MVHFYNGRGRAEQWIKEGKYALNWTRLSCQHFVSNQVRLGLFVLAYNLGNFLRRMVLPRRIKHWSLRTLLAKLIKIGAKVVRHSRMVTFQMAEVAVSEEIWAEILSRIDRLRWSTAQRPVFLIKRLERCRSLSDFDKNTWIAHESEGLFSRNMRNNPCSLVGGLISFDHSSPGGQRNSDPKLIWGMSV